jgi:dihydropteroate synthase
VALSIDTRHETVARAAVAAGASIINDVGGSLARVAGELGVGYVAGHMQGDPQSMQRNPHYGDVVGDVCESVVATAQRAAAAGASPVWIDPGIGFGKTLEHNLELLAHIDRFVATGFPVLLGVSRKGFIGRIHAASDTGLPLDKVAPTATDDRLEGSLALAVWAAALGVDVVRVHDVSATVQAFQVVAAGITV